MTEEIKFKVGEGYVIEPPDMPIILNPLPEGCTCNFELHRTIAEKDYTLIPTRPDPKCAIHPPNRDTLSEQT